MSAVAFLENRQQYFADAANGGGAGASGGDGSGASGNGGAGGNNNGSQGQPASSIKLEALKELTLTLLKEVEALKTEQHEGRRLNLQEEVRRFESEMIRWALKRTSGHQRRAARLLGLKVTTLHAKIKRYRIQTNVFAEADMGLDAAHAPAATTDNNGGDPFGSDGANS